MKTLTLVTLSLVSAASRMSWAQKGSITLRDAREQAFSISVPSNWTSRGGMFRLGLIDARPVVLMTSPDGKSTIQIGDRSIPPYTLASPALARLGFTEGKIFPALGTWPIVARYRRADEYIAKYGLDHFGPMCLSPQARQITSVPNRIVKTPYPGGQLTAAEGYFVCTANGQQMIGYVYAETFSTAPGPGGLWNVAAIGSFLAPAAQAQEVGGVLKQSWETFAFNPAWTTAQTQLVNAVAQRSSGDLQRHLAAAQANFERTMNAIHQQGDEFNDILTGTAHTLDKTTGQIRDVASGTGGRLYINAQNTVAESAMSPGPGFHELQSVSH
jgi:hypothetical protein